MATEFAPPDVSIDSWVYWKYGPHHNECHPALVTRCGEYGSVDCLVFQQSGDSAVCIARTGVKHFTDPALHDARLGGYLISEGTGCWTLSPAELRLQDMKKEIQELRDQLNEVRVELGILKPEPKSEPAKGKKSKAELEGAGV